jgi:hypothetical protein
MKLRIKGASLRLRLTQGEMRELAERGQVEETVPFTGGVSLVYRLRLDAAAEQIQASLRDNVVQILLPEALARSWCDSDQVTLARTQPLAQGSLQITLEKDFACLAPRSDEDESDNFPHPEAARGKVC